MTAKIVPAVGMEWLVDAAGCDRARLRDVPRLRALVDAVLSELRLVPVEAPVWHVFPGEAGVTAMVLLAESHLTLHTFPEHGTIALNLYSCVERPSWPWRDRLALALGATSVEVRSLARGRLAEPR